MSSATISELDRKIICAILDGHTGITDITNQIFGAKRRKEYELVKYHLRAIEDEGIIVKNGNGYKMPEWVDVGNAEVTLKTDDDVLVMEAGKTIFVNGVAGESHATAIIFLEEKQSKNE